MKDSAARDRIRHLLLVALTATVALPFASCTKTGDQRDGVKTAAPPTAPGTAGPSGQASFPPRPPIFYVNPDAPAVAQVARWAADGRIADAAALRKISERPTALWLTSRATPVRDVVARFTGQARLLGQVPVLVADNIPRPSCGPIDPAGGATSPGAYRRWIRDVAAGLGEREVIVILEPNAIPYALDGCVDDAAQRYALLSDAVTVLKSTGPARVYLDAGQPAWIDDINTLAAALARAGIARGDGFALNVSGFVRTGDNVRYGQQVSDALAGHPHFVIDTSRNGNGPYPGETVQGGPTWCNPPGRALGEAPTDRTPWTRVDALLWIKYPGESDGPCRPGEPPAGEWWPEYGLALAGGGR